MKYIIKQLKNKLQVVFIPMASRKSVSASIWVKTGGRYENAANSGISHFLEHLVFRGTKEKTAKDIKQSIEGVGGSLNAFTSQETTCYFAKVPQKYADRAIDVISDIVINPLMKTEDIKKEKMIIAEEIRMYKDMPAYYVSDVLGEIMWPGHPLGRSLAGTYKTVNATSQKMLKDYKQKHYCPSNMALIITGSVKIDSLSKKINSLFGSLKPGGRGNFKNYVNRQKKASFNFLNKDTEQTHLSLGFHTPSRTHPDRYAFGVLSVILGGNMSSRLFEKVREESGLAYQISTSIKKYCDTGVFTIDAGIRNKKTIEALGLILKELTLIKKETVKIDELRRAKEFLTGQLLINLEDTMDSMLWANEKVTLEGRIPDIKKILKQIEAVSVDDIKRVAGSILKENNLNLASIGPLKKDIKDIKRVISNFS
ncbi:MAG: insulinase family protein [Candidatus Omnitrophica bacterium]|nr:insulinase family protein [Candidatus Omnitrophota bacterium]